MHPCHVSNWYKNPIRPQLVSVQYIMRMAVAALVVCVLAVLVAWEPVSSVPLTLYKRPQTSSAPEIVCPGGDTSCGSSATCCKTGKESYGCCKHEKAVCCSDMKHCCPSGYYCGDGFCHPVNQHPLLSLQAHTSEGVLDIPCSDGGACPNGDTCCPTSSTKDGCCPHPKAVCCSDMKHCCPAGYKCSSTQCLLGFHPLLELVTIPIEGEAPIQKNIPCQDGGTCTTGQTCCAIAGNKFGCCPQPSAVCCPDLKHCCAAGSVCDKGKCIRFGESHPLLQLTVRPLVVSPDVKCADGGTCPSGDTCCMNGVNTYGCCPERSATCCSDMKHCCPSGTSCSGTKCIGSTSHPLLQLTVRPVGEKVLVENVICPDKKSECPTGDTCCKNGAHSYGCCPQVHAVCCSDMKHCCPRGTTCSGEKCIKSTSHPLLQLTIRPLVVSPDINCPDGGTCPSSDTCCKTGADSYGCCPKVAAVCCSDMKHCCPSGFSCSKGKCIGSTSHPLLQLTVRPLVVSPDIKCSDGTTCPSSDTCCKTGATSFGCCPRVAAVCCSDLKHCCPSGFECKGKECVKMSPHPLVELSSRPLVDPLVELSSRPLVDPLVELAGGSPSDVGNVVCPNGINECSDGATCCQVSNKVYGCCPKGNAVCCEDGKHCCPTGYTCEKGIDVCKEKDGSYRKLIPFV